MSSGRQLDLFRMYLEEVERISACSQAENEMLLGRAMAGEQEAKQRLVEGNLKLALGMIGDYLNKGVQTGDLVQEANIALVMAVEELETAAGELLQGGFEAFVKNRVREALAAALARQSAEVKVQEEMAARVNVLKDVSRAMAEELGREATVEELAEKMKMSVGEVKDIMKMTLDAMAVSG